MCLFGVTGYSEQAPRHTNISGIYDINFLGALNVPYPQKIGGQIWKWMRVAFAQPQMAQHTTVHWLCNPRNGVQTSKTIVMQKLVFNFDFIINIIFGKDWYL